jgi:hypothetical protein
LGEEHVFAFADFLAMKPNGPMSELSSPPIRLEDFVLGPVWQELPFDIKVGVAHIWVGEQQASQLDEVTPIPVPVTERRPQS